MATPPPAPSPDLVLALLADARLPVGGHTQSGGLEPALVHGGLTSADVPAFLRGRLATVVAVEAGTAVVARHRALTAGALGSAPGEEASGEAVFGDVEEAWAARTASAPLREASRTLGRGYLRLAQRLWPGSAVLDALGRRPPRPLVLGAVAALAGLDAARLVRLCGHEDAATLGAAALKLDPLDPAETVVWTLAAHPLVEELVPRLVGLTDPAEIPAGSAPLVEEHSLRHARTTHRLFQA
ncbi:urease accessory protein UreF [Kineococcus sp. G2]|uniref:urease accessory protein UreF n=1 Tax=Kineococcus sp. G2 TaxID=3127484 RepID=UPI00301DB7B7